MISHTTIIVPPDASWIAVSSLIASWFAAIGTVGAVIVSLYLARQAYRVKLRVGAGIWKTFAVGEPDPPHQDILQIDVTNLGLRIARVSVIGWQIGKRFRRKQYFYHAMVPGAMSPPLPHAIGEGERATWAVPLQPWITQWREAAASRSLDLSTLKVVVSTTYGTKHIGVPDNALLDRIRDAVNSGISSP